MLLEQSRDKKPFDLAIAGELNLDLVLYGLPLDMPTERDLIGSSFVCTLGSSSAIVAHNAAVLGLRVQFSSLAGDDDFGAIALDRLKQAGIDTAGTRLDRSTTTGVTILLPHGDQRHSLISMGSIAELTVGHLDLGRLVQARHFHLSSLYLQKGLHSGIVAMLVQLRSAGLTLSLDTNDDPDDAWGPPLAELLPLVDFFMPNERELCCITGGDNLDRATQIFAERFGDQAPILVIKRGRHGCRIGRRSQVFDVAGLSVEPIDTIGAGDSFNAGFLTAYLRGKDLATCARIGNITAALSTLSNGGTEAFRDATLREAFLTEHGYFKL